MQLRFIGAMLLSVLTFSLLAQPVSLQAQPASTQSQPAPKPVGRPATLDGHPNFNGIWQAMNTAYWNLEAHNAVALDQFWQLGAIAAIPAGRSMLKGGGTIPYLPKALAQRNQNRAKWPADDPEARCYMLGVPRVTYHDMPFQIVQGDKGDDLLMVYAFAATNRVIHMTDHSEPPIDTWMGKSDGHWEGDTLVVVTTGQNERTWLDRAGNFHSNELKVTERFTLRDSDHLLYQATLEDPQTYSQPWTIEMPLYRSIEEHAQLLEHKCVPFADKLLYSDLIMGGHKP